MGVRAVAVVAVLCALAPGASLASPQLQPGVHIDPGSPAGKQYSIPIDSARSQTGGGHGSAGSARGANPPIFGSGVVAKPVLAPKPGGSTVKPSGRSRSRASRVARATPRRASRVVRRKVSASARSRQPVARPTDQAALVSASAVGGNAWVALVGGGALVLVVGGVGGLLIRRLRW